MTRGRPWMAMLTLILTGAPTPAAGAVRADECVVDALVGLEAHRRRLGALGAESAARERLEQDAVAVGAETAGAWRDFAVVAEAILDRPPGSIDAVALVAAVDASDRRSVPCRSGTIARDRLAHRMVLGGYSATEVADVVAGRLTLREVDHAQALVMTGHADRAAAMLDQAIARRAPRRAPPLVDGNLGTRLARYRSRIDEFARRHDVSAALVEAMVAVESAARTDAISPKGAIGLMQLMPATAASLGVDPSDPDQNLEGGIRYLAGLLSIFRDETLALIAYNAGPTHARRVARGEAVVYDETRRYVAAIRKRLGH